MSDLEKLEWRICINCLSVALYELVIMEWLERMGIL